MTAMNSSQKSMTSAAFGVLIVILISKIIGFVESAILAAYFGTSPEVDMFYLANNIVNKFIFTIFSGLGVIGLTMYNNARKEDSATGDRFITALLCTMVPLAILVSIIIYFSAPAISQIMANAYSEYEKILLSKFIVELSSISVFYVLSTIFTCVLNAHRKFLPAVFMSIVQNVVLIIFILSLSNQIGVNAVVIAFPISFVIQTIILYLCVNKFFKFSKFSFTSDINFKRVIILIIPLILAEATSEINMLIDQYIATLQGPGTVSGLAYSETLNDVVTALFMQTITTVLLSYFSSLAVNKQYEEMLTELKKIVKIIIITLIPISIITIICSDQIVSFIFERGEFQSGSVRITALALIGYAVGFAPRVIMVIAKRPFFAIENTKTPMIIGILAVVINIILTIWLSSYWGVFGITISTSISYMIACLIYFIQIRICFRNINISFNYKFILKVLIASVIGTLTVVSIQQIEWSNNFISLSITTVLCLFFYLLSLKLLKIQEINILILKVKGFLTKYER